jgi:hypothetical protein
VRYDRRSRRPPCRHGAQAAVRQSNRETAARVDQTCAISEAKQRSDSDALIRTYRYLSSLSGRQLAQPINRAILANLPVTIRAAQIDDAPAFCDKPGVGLPEPDPPLPCAPKHVKGCIAPPAQPAARLAVRTAATIRRMARALQAIVILLAVVAITVVVTTATTATSGHHKTIRSRSAGPATIRSR